MITHHKVEGYDAYLQKIKELDGEKNVVVYFSGSATDEAISWCPDCVEAQPVITEALKKHEEKTFHFVYVSVGPRTEWTADNQFKTDAELKLNTVPTIILRKKVLKLEEDECKDAQNIDMLLEEIEK